MSRRGCLTQWGWRVSLTQTHIKYCTVSECVAHTGIGPHGCVTTWLFMIIYYIPSAAPEYIQKRIEWLTWRTDSLLMTDAWGTYVVSILKVQPGLFSRLWYHSFSRRRHKHHVLTWWPTAAYVCMCTTINLAYPSYGYDYGYDIASTLQSNTTLRNFMWTLPQTM